MTGGHFGVLFQQLSNVIDIRNKKIYTSHMPRLMKITPQRIKDVLSYDPETGSLTWKSKTSAWDRTGDEAAPLPNDKGYRYISLDKGDYLAHRLAWVIMKGEFPKGRLTFKDGDKSNLKWENLIERQPLCKAKFDHRTAEGKSAYGKAWRAANPGKYKERALKDSFGIDLREYEDMLIAQKGCCAICNKRETMKRKGKDVALAVDHCHKTGQVRGLLCTACNKGLGQFEDNQVSLSNAISYLAKHKEKKKNTNEKVIKFTKS